MLINEMMYGGSLKDIFQSAYLMNLPEWFVKGAVNYVALGWTVEMDDFVRQVIRTRQVKKLSRFTGREAASSDNRCGTSLPSAMAGAAFPISLITPALHATKKEAWYLHWE